MSYPIRLEYDLVSPTHGFSVCVSHVIPSPLCPRIHEYDATHSAYIFLVSLLARDEVLRSRPCVVNFPRSDIPKLILIQAGDKMTWKPRSPYTIVTSSGEEVSTPMAADFGRRLVQGEYDT